MNGQKHMVSEVMCYLMFVANIYVPLAVFECCTGIALKSWDLGSKSLFRPDLLGPGTRLVKKRTEKKHEMMNKNMKTDSDSQYTQMRCGEK